MSGKNLTFKLVMDADTKDYVSNTKQAQDVTVKVFGEIKREAEEVRKASEAISKELENIVPKGTKELVESLNQSLTKATEIINGAGEHASEAANNFTDFGRKSEKAIDVVKSDLAEAKQKLQEFADTKATPADIDHAQAEVDQLEKEVQQVDQAFDGFNGAVADAGVQAEKSNSKVETLSKGFGAAKFAVTALVGAMGALGVGLGIRELAQAADSYTNLSVRINIATQEGGNFNQAMAGVHQVALMTNSTLEATGSLFTRINTISKDMGMSQQQALDLTKTVTQAIQIGGGSAEASEAAVQQFIQAMQGGVLRGEEFNSIMENGYGLAEALAKGLGVTTGELRKMAENGELSSERVIKAIQSQSASIQETYSQFPTTISNALQKIATSWQILIGEMDQANGASATVAQWLSTLADNMSLLKPIIDDIGQGLIRFGDYYSSIYDQSTLDSLKTALVSIYNTIKTLFNTVLEVGEATNDLFSDALSAVLGFTDGLYPAGQQVSGFQKFIDLLNIAIGLLSDGFKSIGIVVNLFTGTLYGLASAWYEFKSIFTWGDVKDQAIANMEAMRAKSQEYFDKGFDGIKNFESQTLSSIDNIKKSEEQKNQELVANNQKKLDELKAQEEKHKSDYKAISDERLRLEQQLFDARKSGNQASIDLATKGLAELDAKEKAYQAESQKITDAKIESAQAIATAMIQSADAAGMAQLKVLNAQLATQGLKAEFDSTGKVIVSAMDDGTKATENQSNATDKARKAAAALGIDLDIALNRVSEKFASDQGHLKNYANGLEAMGATGAQATELIYQGWQKWAEQAKSPAEIDAAKAQLGSFEKQGVFSAKQVEMGMRYLDEVNGKLPANISEVEKAYKLLGITSSAEANKMADAQMKAFNVMTKSGTASAEQIHQALINMADKIYASGDAAKIAWYEGQLAANGLASSVDDAGRKSVSAMSSLEDANNRVGDSARSAISGYRELGDAVRQEAKSSIEAWNEMMDARSKAEKENRTQRVGADFTTYNVSDIQSKLSGMGYDEAEAAKIAKNILNQALEIDKDKAMKARLEGGIYGEYNAKAFEKLIAQGQTSAFGTQKVNELLARYMAGQGSAKTGTRSADVNALAPEVNVAVPTTNVEQSKDRVIQNNITINGKTISVPVTESSQGSFDEFLSELEQLKRAM